MRITRLETFLVKPRWLFLKIHTNAGITGWGEPILEGRARTGATAVQELESYLVGKDPRAVAHHWQAIYRHAFYRGGPILTSALSGIDQALWDIKGKALQVPVYELLGGPTRERIRVYAHAGSPEAVKDKMQQGFTAFKTGPAKKRPARPVETPQFVDYAAEKFAELRQAGEFGFEEGARQGKANSAFFEPDGGLLELQGQAQVSSEGGNLSARRIVLDRASGRVDAIGAVTGFLVQDQDAAEQSGSVGIFADQEPVFLAAGALANDPESQTLEYRDGARLWQGASRIDADSIVVNQASNRISASDNVEAVWSESDAQGQESSSLSIVRSSQMRYQARTGIARFEGAVDFRRQGMRVLADELQTALGQGEEDSETRAIAKGSVRIADPPDGSGHRAFGDQAEFDTAASEVVLTGQPAKIVMPDGTESEGGSLTYRIAGDRLLVLGQGAERTYTYRPVSR